MSDMWIAQWQEMNIQFDVLIFTNAINILALCIDEIYDLLFDIWWNIPYNKID